MDDLLREFLTEAGEHLDTVDGELVRLERNACDRNILRNIFRLVHTIKGTCGFLGLPRLEALAHAAEGLMERLRDERSIVAADWVTLILATVDRLKFILAELERLQVEPAGSDEDLIADLHRAAEGSHAAAPAAARTIPSAARPAESGRPSEPGGAGPADPRDPAERTVRVGIDTLEHLMTKVSELVLTRNQLLDQARRLAGGDVLREPLQRLSDVTAALQDGVMKTRMHPIGGAWTKLPRLVRDLSVELGKPLDLVMTGVDVELDRQIIEIVRDPFTHLVRNAADHGIEDAVGRAAAGKPAAGSIRLSASQDGGAVTIEVADDGRGLDYEGIRRQAVRRGLAKPSEIAAMSDRDLAEFIFEPGFSTTGSISSISGRGVGMDVVKTNVMKVGGTIEIASEPGRGALFRIKISLTLAIVSALIVDTGGQRFALPQVAIVEVAPAAPGSDQAIRRVDGIATIRLRDRSIPVVDMAALLRLPRAGDADRGSVVVAQIGSQRVGLLVESVLAVEEIVVKPMAGHLSGLEMFSGHTILADGTIALVLDPSGLGRRLGHDVMRTAEAAARQAERAGGIDGAALLVVRGRDLVLKAAPLSLATRLEWVDGAAIEWPGGRPMLRRDGRLVPIVHIDEGVEPARTGSQALVIVTDGAYVMGLAVGEIVDIADGSFDVERVGGRPDLVGRATLRGRPTEIVDLAAFLPRAHRGWTFLSARARAASGTALLVDDNPFFLALLGPVLRAASLRVSEARGREEALRALALHSFDVLVTDLDLGGGDGLDLVAAMRRMPEGAALPVVALASGADDATLARARALGVDAVVAKFDRIGLLAALHAARLAVGEAA